MGVVMSTTKMKIVENNSVRCGVVTMVARSGDGLCKRSGSVGLVIDRLVRVDGVGGWYVWRD